MNSTNCESENESVSDDMRAEESVARATCGAGAALASECLSRDIPETLPLLVLKSVVPLPLQVVSTQITRSFNLTVLDELDESDELVAAAALVSSDSAFAKRNIAKIAVACKVLSRMEMGDGSSQVVLQAMRRIRIDKVLSSRPTYVVEVSCVEEPNPPPARERELTARLIASLRELIELDPRHPDELMKVAQLNESMGSRFADLLANRLPFGYDARRQVLECLDVGRRLILVTKFVEEEIARSRIREEISTKTDDSQDRIRREALLREQLEIIRHELDELDPQEAARRKLDHRIETSALPRAVAEEARRQVARLRDSSVESLEGSTIRAYVDWVLAMPWERELPVRVDLRRARRILDERHPGLEDARDQLLEFLAIRRLGGASRRSILAIVGPPGSGRTTLAHTLAEVMGLPLARVPLRAVRDEADVLGMPLTEPLARPGNILEAIKQAGAINPILLVDDFDLLEENDLIGAVLQGLDPARNAKFGDRYLGVPFDLSRALFIVTASIVDDIPEQIWPRVDVVELPGYTDQVKLAIARNHTWPQVIKASGLDDFSPKITDAAIQRIIRDYTREAGLAELRERLETICRAYALRAAQGPRSRLKVTIRNLESLLGPAIYARELRAKEGLVGCATGLAWTESGGDLLPIESLLMSGEGRTILTGLLGEVMQESVAAALSYVRYRAEALKIPRQVFQESDIHIHFPEGAIPKDGPSAGITVATILASLLSGRPVRQDVAMTGELTLQGTVLPIGGLREKMLAADRAGIRHVIVPKGNASEYATVPKEVQARQHTHFVSHVDEVFKIALRSARSSRSKARTARSRS